MIAEHGFSLMRVVATQLINQSRVKGCIVCGLLVEMVLRCFFKATSKAGGRG